MEEDGLLIILKYKIILIFNYNSGTSLNHYTDFQDTFGGNHFNSTFLKK